MSETPNIIGMFQNSPYAYEQRRLNFSIDGSKKRVFSTSDDKINFLVLLGPSKGKARLHGDEPFFWGEGLNDDSKIKKFLEIKNCSLELIYDTPNKIEKLNEKIISGLKYIDEEEVEYTKESNEILKENPTYISFCTILLTGLLNAWEQYEKTDKIKVLDLIRDNIFYILKKAYGLEYNFKIEYEGMGNYYGFTLDGNHKFLLGNFIVTHNTLPAEFAIQYFKEQSLEDNGMAIFRMQSGATASLHSSLTHWKNLFHFEVFGQDGYVAVEGLGASYGTEKLIFGKKDFEAPFNYHITEY